MSNRILLPMVLTAALLGTAALATSSQVTGLIKAIDAGGQTVTLADGSVFTLPEGFKTDGYKAGDKVVVTWDLVGTEHQLLTMSPG